MKRSTNLRLLAAAVPAVLALALTACGDDEESSATTDSVVTTDPATTTAETAVTPESVSTTPATEPAETTPDTSEPDTTVADTEATTTEPPTTTAAPTTTIAPDEIQSLPGMGSVEVTVDGDDASRPVFSWTAPAEAVSYQLTVQSADGTPVWGWTGGESEIVLGGAARPANVEGPTLVGPSRVRVYAFDAGNVLIAVSAWVPVEP